MKKLEFIKTVELFLFLGLSGICLYLVVLGSNVYHQIAESRDLQLVCMLLWISLFSSFLFIFLDFSLFSKQKSDFNALDYAVHSDTLANIANRQGIDNIIDKYVDEPLPENFGCTMFLLTSLNEINRTSRKEGNAQIKSFSIILKLASTDLCFVGRNGGNVFMALFEDSSQEEIDTFMRRVEEKVIEYNHKKDTKPMYYQYGLAFHEDPHPESVNALISISSKKAHAAETTPKGVKRIQNSAPTALIEEKKEIFVESKPMDTPKPKDSHEDIKPDEPEPVKVEYIKTKPSKPEPVISENVVDYRYTDEELFGKRDQSYIEYYREAI